MAGVTTLEGVLAVECGVLFRGRERTMLVDGIRVLLRYVQLADATVVRLSDLQVAIPAVRSFYGSWRRHAFLTRVPGLRDRLLFADLMTNGPDLLLKAADFSRSRPPSSQLAVTLTDLEDIVRVSAAQSARGLRQVVEALTGTAGPDVLPVPAPLRARRPAPKLAREVLCEGVWLGVLEDETPVVQYTLSLVGQLGVRAGDLVDQLIELGAYLPITGLTQVDAGGAGPKKLYIRLYAFLHAAQFAGAEKLFAQLRRFQEALEAPDEPAAPPALPGPPELAHSFLVCPGR